MASGGSHHAYDEDDEKDAANPVKRYAEYDCPSCNANNPCSPPIGDKDEISCHYCGTDFKVFVSDEGKLKLKEQ